MYTICYEDSLIKMYVLDMYIHTKQCFLNKLFTAILGEDFKFDNINRMGCSCSTKVIGI